MRSSFFIQSSERSNSAALSFALRSRCCLRVLLRLCRARCSRCSILPASPRPYSSCSTFFALRWEPTKPFHVRGRFTSASVLILAPNKFLTMISAHVQSSPASRSWLDSQPISNGHQSGSGPDLRKMVVPQLLSISMLIRKEDWLNHRALWQVSISVLGTHHDGTARGEQQRSRLEHQVNLWLKL